MFQQLIQWREVYAAVDNGTCTDSITTDILLDRLDSLQRWDLMVATMVLTGCYLVVSGPQILEMVFSTYQLEYMYLTQVYVCDTCTYLFQTSNSIR